MNTSVITIKVDPVTKKQAQHIASELGLSLSAVLKVFLKRFIKAKAITFSTQGAEIPNARTLRTLKKAEENYKKGNTSPAFKTGEEAVAWLEKQGV